MCLITSLKYYKNIKMEQLDNSGIETETAHSSASLSLALNMRKVENSDRTIDDY